MPIAHAPRAVVFSLEDLPAEDRRHIHEVAQHLNLLQQAESWRVPLVLVPRDIGPLPPGLLNDVELAASGPSLLLLAVRLLLADAWSWPEQRFLRPGEASPESQAGYAIYASQPGRWTCESLAHALIEQAHLEVQRGLQPRSRRTWAPADSVPVLGWQVPMLGRPDPVARLCDTRPPEERQHRFGSIALPAGVVPGHVSGQSQLYLRVLLVRRVGDRAEAEIEVLRADAANGSLGRERLRLGLSHAMLLGESEDEEGLDEVLRELLPGCIFCCPQGGLLLLDLHGTELRLLERQDGALGPVRLAAPIQLPLPEDEGAAPLDPALWEAGQLPGLLHPEECRVSSTGRLVALRFSGRRDGEPVDAILVLDTVRGRPLLWQAELAGPAPAVALHASEVLLALVGAEMLSPACLGDGTSRTEEEMADWLQQHRGELVMLAVPPAGADAPLRVCAALPLPAALRGPGLPVLHCLPDDQTLIVLQPATRTLGTIELPDPASPRLRPTTSADLVKLLSTDGGVALVGALAAAAGEMPEAAVEASPLGWLARTLIGGLLPGAAAELRRLALADAVQALLHAPALSTLLTTEGGGAFPLRG
ncbi:MAG: hypothetical protein RMK29_00375 [Myxococcales bacterium]|nr:hypothetical protein [Myxococcota bacterium]MDW8280131.1 hypothetical protein [Myxococcales bacterium]